MELDVYGVQYGLILLLSSREQSCLESRTLGFEGGFFFPRRVANWLVWNVIDSKHHYMYLINAMHNT
jgi:hypothetical protein